MNMLILYEICPIVFNLLEKLKDELRFRRNFQIIRYRLGQNISSKISIFINMKEKTSFAGKATKLLAKKGIKM